MDFALEKFNGFFLVVKFHHEKTEESYLAKNAIPILCNVR